MVKFIDPRAEVGVQLDAYELSIDLRAQSKPTVAFVANGFPDSVAFLAQVRKALQALVPGLQAVELDKGNASITVSDALLEKIQGADAAVAAYGH